MARASAHTAEIAALILDRLAAGETLRSICRGEGMPAASTVRGWVVDDVQGFAAAYARAREMGAYEMTDELIEIADDGRNDWMSREDPENPGFQANGENLARSRLRSDNRKWLASKILPRVFGDKLDLTHSGEVNVRSLTDEELASEIARLRTENERLAGGGSAAGAEPAASEGEDRSGTE